MLRRKLGFTLVELMVVVAIIGILAAIAIPNFLRFQARAKQAEAKTNLRAIFTGERARYAETEAYSTKMGEIGFAPERGNRYSYDLGDPAIVSMPGVGFACLTVEMRTAASLSSTGVQCGVSADIFRYQANIVPGYNTGRSSVTFSSTVASVAPLAADSIGITSTQCPLCDFAARALGNVDDDPGADEFFISSQYGSTVASPCGEQYAGLQPGSPLPARSDINCE